MVWTPMCFNQVPRIPDDGPLEVLCVARLIERKGQQDLSIKAVKRLSDWGARC